MIELANRMAEAAWKIKNLDDYRARLERAARRVGELTEWENAALAIYEAALMSSGRPREEVRGMVRRFKERFEDEEEPLSIPRVSAIMKVEGGEWFFGDEDIRIMTGQLLGQFQHRVAQYNYIDEREVLRRWADSYDTRLFIRRRIFDTEPVAGVIGGVDFGLMQYLRVVAGGDSLVPSEAVARGLTLLGFDESADEYDTLACAESLALHLELPAPVVAEMLEEFTREDFRDFPEPPAQEPAETAEQPAEEPELGRGDKAARRAARQDPRRGEEPSRVQDPQGQDVPGVAEEKGAESPAPPAEGTEDAPGTSGGKDGS